MKPIRFKSLLIGSTAGFVAGIAIATYFTIADWRLNPGGIFHDVNGTRWAVVLETGFSWLVPVALLVFVVVTALHYCLVATTGRRQRGAR